MSLYVTIFKKMCAALGENDRQPPSTAEAVLLQYNWTNKLWTKNKKITNVKFQ